jgi:hypothetical protein
VRHLLGVPVLALHDDVFVAAEQLQVDAAVEARPGCTGTAVFDSIAFIAIVGSEHALEVGRVRLLDGIAPTMPYVL